MKSLDKFFRQKMIELRKSKGMTQEELGALLGVKKLQVSKYENGEAGVDLDLAHKIADALEVPVEMLVCEPGDENEMKAEIIAWVKKAPPDLVRTLHGIIVPVVHGFIKVHKS